MTRKQWLFGGTISLIFLLISVVFYVYQIFFTANFQVGEAKGDKFLFIPEKTDFKTLLNIMKREQIINDVVSFAFIAKIMSYQEHVKAGRYLIKKNMGNYRAVQMLRAGLQTPVKVMFNQARFPEELAEKVAESLNFSQEDLLKELKNPETLKKFGFDTTNIMAMFLPNTYEVYWNNSPKAFLERMHKEYLKFWNEKRKEKAKNLNLTPIEVSILASIVQAETAKKDEKPRVAGVYLNRLRKKMRLEADPTLIFAAKDFTIKRVLNIHKENNSPYNTYKFAGLPPGTINMPTEESIDATLNAEKHDYIFFCAKADGSNYHNFAVTYNDHLKNARLYHRYLDLKKTK